MMAEMKNLTEENVSELRRFFTDKIKPVNPDATLDFIPMPQIFESSNGCGDCKKEIEELKEKMEILINKVNHIFGDSFLYNGEFISVKDQGAKKALGI